MKSQDFLIRALLCSTSAAALSPALSPALAQTLPTGATVVAGRVGFAHGGAGLTINQSSQNAIVNYDSFSIGRTNTVTFNQPNSQSAILNRVTGDTPSAIAGQLRANGQVYLVNPNGIAITKTGTIDVGGGFAASTLGMSDQEFLRGQRRFTGNGASAAVSNAGTIRIGRGGYAALIGGAVSNSGSIAVPMGKVGLGAGEAATLDVSGDGFLQVAVPTAAGGKGALIDNSGRIAAEGGSVVISAATARAAARQVVHIGGTIDAHSIAGHDGSIVIGGGEGGAVRLSGRMDVSSRTARGGTITVTGQKVRLKGATLLASGRTGGGSVRIGGNARGAGPLLQADAVTMDAASTIAADATGRGDGGTVVLWSTGPTVFKGLVSARGGPLGGNGGSVESSGRSIDFTGARVDTSATRGRTGQWLTDPDDLTVDASAAATIATNLATTNVTLQTTASGTSGPGTANAGAGDITIAAPISWSSGNLLTLDAYHGITVAAPITVAGAGGVVLTTNDGGTGGILGFGLGPSGFAGSLSYTGNGGSLQIDGNSYTLLYSMADIQAVNASPTALAGRYALATTIADASTVTDWQPVGTDGNGTPLNNNIGFNGSFEGLGHSIQNLSISLPGTQYVGLFGWTSGATIQNLGLTGGSVTGQNYVGSLIGYASNGGTVANVTSSDSVSGGSQVGGLVGHSESSIFAAVTSGSVTGTSDFTGGLVGYASGGTISGSSATGTVGGANYTGGLVGLGQSGTVTSSFATGAVTGGSQVGGLIGQNQDIVSAAYASGSVTGSDITGGLVGYAAGGTISGSSATGTVGGANYTGGLVGLNQGQTITSSFATGTVTGSSRVGGLIGQNQGTVDTSYATGSVTANSDGVGGFVGWDYGTIGTGQYATGNVIGTNNNYTGGFVGVEQGSDLSGDWSTGTVTGNSYTGGFAGYNDRAIANSYATGAVSATGSTVGGFLGDLNGGSLSGVYASASVTYTGTSGNGGDQFGGLVGRMEQNTSVIDSYHASGAVTGTSNVGGLVGYLSPNDTISNSFYDIDAATVSGATSITAGGLYDGQFQSWLPTKTLTIGTYFAGPDANGAYSLSTIQNLKDFLGFAETPGLQWTLANDIDLTAMPGQVIPYFAGSFDGGGHAVSNLSIAESNSNLGLFGYGRGATIQNLTVGGSVQGLDFVGGVVGSMSNGASTPLIANVTSSADVTTTRLSNTVTGSGSYTGGLAGYVYGAVSNASASGAVTGGNTYTGGLIGFGAGGGTITASSTSGTVTGGGDQTGGLVGQSNNPIDTSTTSGPVLAPNTNYTGGLVGYATASISGSTSSGVITGGNIVGGLVGQNGGGTLSASSATGAVSGGTYAGGLIGLNNATVSNAFATGNVVSNGSQVGGLIGQNTGTVSLSYATGTVSGSGQVGGFVGYTQNTISTSYATGNVTGGDVTGGFAGENNGSLDTVYATGTAAGSNLVGGLVGRMDNNSSLVGSYATGAVTGQLAVGGLIGTLNTSASVSNSHYDQATVQINGTTLWGLGALTDSQYASWIGNNRSLTLADYGFAPDAGGFYGISTIQNVKDFLGFADVAGLSWKLENNLDLASAPGLFIPYFSGASFDGGGFTVSHLAVAQASSGLGLFGAVFNANLTNINVSGSVTATPVNGSVNNLDDIGGLVGSFYTAAGNTIANATAAVAVSGGNQVGGLVGYANGAISNAAASGIVSGVSQTGGLVGAVYNAISSSTATGTVSGTGDSTGGLVGFVGGGTIANTSATGAVTGASYTGGLVGLAQGDTISGSFATGAVRGDSRVGGLIGQNQQTITTSYATGAVTADSDGVGGFVGWDYGTIGTGQYASGAVIATNNSYSGGFVGVEQGNGLTGDWATGNVSGNSNVGGFAGYDDRTIVQSYATGTVTGSGGAVGGFVGQHNGGSITASTATGAVSGGTFVGGFVGLQYAQEAGNSATGTVAGSSETGGYAGRNQGTITTGSASGTVSGGGVTGGFVGHDYGSTTNSLATGLVTGQSNQTGGFVGLLEGGTETSDYATGAVYGTTQVGGFAGVIVNTTNTADVASMGAVFGTSQVGGLVGALQNSNVSTSFATGYVQASTVDQGGLVGSVDSVNDTITDSYFNTQTTGQSAGVGPSGGLYTGDYQGVTGQTTAQLQSVLPTGFGTTAWSTGTGLYPYLNGLFATPPQAIVGAATTAAGDAAAGAQVGLYQDGVLLGQATASVGADGSYYEVVAAGTLAANDARLGAILTLAGASAVSGRAYTDATPVPVNVLDAGTVQDGFDRQTTAQTAYSGLQADLGTTFGAVLSASLQTALAQTPLAITATGSGFTLDQSVTAQGGLSVATTGSNAPIVVSATLDAGSRTVALDATGTITQTSGTIVTGTLTGSSHGAASFGSTGNAIAALAAFSTTGNGALTVIDTAPSLEISGSVALGSGALTVINAGGDLVVGSGGSITGGTILLAANGTFVNDAGANAIVPVAGQNFVISSQTPGDVQGTLPGDQFGGLAGVDYYNDAFDFTSGAFATPVPAATNSFVYGYAATLVPTLGGSTTKTYDGLTTAPTGSLTVGASLLGAGDSVTLALVAATFDTAHGGTGKTVTATGVSFVANPNNYSLASTSAVGAVGIITPAPLTITADDRSKVYGAAMPTFSASYAGFVNGDTIASLSALPTIFTTATAASHVAGSPYAVTASGAASSDYAIGYVGGYLSVTAAPLTITADNQSKVYGAAVPTLTASYAGFVNGDTAASLSTLPILATTATAASHVAGGPYAVTAGGAASSDYAISYVGGYLSVTAAPLTITANNQSKVYGAALPTLTASYAGFVNGDTAASLSTLPILATTATAASHVAGGPYAVTAGGAASSDYAIGYVGGYLSVTAAPLTITADDQSKLYGAALPTLTASYAGFVNGDTALSLSALPTLATTATAASHVAGGPYAVTASGAVSSDYAIGYVGGYLSVTPAPLTITANNQSKVYGAALPLLTASYAGFVNGDTALSLSVLPILATTATAASHVAGGPYAVTAGGAASSDYAIGYVGGYLSVTAAPLTITANNQSKVYGAALPTLTASYAGFVNGDTAASLSTPPLLSTTATAGSHVAGGPYAVTASGAVSSDYAIGYLAGHLAVTPAPLTIAAEDASRSVQSVNPPLLARLVGLGLRFDDKLSGSLTTSADIGSPAGRYVITIGTLTAGADYGVTYIPGTLTVEPQSAAEIVDVGTADLGSSVARLIDDSWSNPARRLPILLPRSTELPTASNAISMISDPRFESLVFCSIGSCTVVPVAGSVGQ